MILVPFPFADLSASKLRPAIVLAVAARGDVVLCQVTSRDSDDPQAVPLLHTDFAQGSLHRASFARPARLFTASPRLIIRQVRVLRPGARRRIVASVVRLLQPNPA